MTVVNSPVALTFLKLADEFKFNGVVEVVEMDCLLDIKDSGVEMDSLLDINDSGSEVDTLQIESMLVLNDESSFSSSSNSTRCAGKV